MAHEHNHHHGHVHAHGGHSHAPAAAPGDELAQCPVMPGSMAVKAEAEAAGLVREYEGTTYYLCCDACAPMFDADPAQYVGA